MNNIFNRYYKRYDAWYEKRRYAFLSEVQTLRQVLPKRGKGLEIGVGTGRFAQALGIKFGIDPAQKMLRVARKRGVRARVGKGEKLPFKNCTFDYVAIIITLSFAKNPRAVVGEAKRVLKPKGKIIIGIIDKDSFLGRFYKEKKGPFYKQANFLQVREVSDWLKRLAFKHFQYYQTVFKLPDRIKSIEKPKKGFGRGGFVVISAKKA